MEFGRYKVLSQLGQGGMATVYLAEDPLLQRLVAVKVIQSHLASNTGLIERFMLEAKTIAALRHMNIVEIFDFGIQQGQQYLVMEYIDGHSLQLVCSVLGGGPMPNEFAAAVICQAAEGLTSAEKNGVVHRDIKPENLLFNSEGLLKIADFGIAHIADEQSRTQTGAVLGSPNFMAPEQIEGLKPTHKTDLFALGGVFFYCLTGRMPFTGNSLPVTMRNICEFPPPDIPSLNPLAAPELVELVETLLRKKPEDRGEGARWLANRLRAYLGGKGIVDIAEASRNFISGLGVGGSTTLSEGTDGTGSGARPVGASGASAFPSSTGAKGGTLAGPGSQWRPQPPESRQPTYQPQATTGAMGPSSRSPLLWVGILLSVSAVLLAGILVWTRLEEGRLPGPSARGGTPVLRPEAAAESLKQAVTETAVIAMGNPRTGLPGNQPRPPETKPPEVRPPRPPVEPKPVPAGRTGATVSVNPSGQRGQNPPAATRPERPKEARPPGRPPEPERMAYIMIKSAPPFAAVNLNGRPAGETPMSNYLEVPAGPVRIELIHRLHPPFDTTIHLAPGKRSSLKFKLYR